MADDKRMTDDTYEIQIEWSPDTPFEAVNGFRISRISDEVQILIGYVNLAFALEWWCRCSATHSSRRRSSKTKVMDKRLVLPEH